jgi:hypothetical protein
MEPAFVVSDLETCPVMAELTQNHSRNQKKKNTKIQTTGEILPNTSVFYSQTPSSAILDPVTSPMTAPALKSPSMAIYSTQKEPKVRKSDIFTQTELEATSTLDNVTLLPTLATTSSSALPRVSISCKTIQNEPSLLPESSQPSSATDTKEVHFCTFFLNRNPPESPQNVPPSCLPPKRAQHRPIPLKTAKKTKFHPFSLKISQTYSFRIISIGWMM